jgi:hypothetical protein
MSRSRFAFILAREDYWLTVSTHHASQDSSSPNERSNSVPSTSDDPIVVDDPTPRIYYDV